MSASFIAQGVYPAFPTFLPLGGHYSDRPSRGGAASCTAMGTVSKSRVGDGKGAAAAQTSALADERRTSMEGNLECENQSTTTGQASSAVRESSHAPSQAETSHSESSQAVSSSSFPSSEDHISASMADNRYPPMSAQFSPWGYAEFAGPSNASYSRYTSTAPSTEATDEYDVLAHNQLVSRSMEQPFTAAAIPGNWASASSFQHSPYPTNTFLPASYPEYQWQYSHPMSPQSMTSPLSGMLATTQAPFGNQFHHMPSTAAIPIATKAQEPDTGTNVSPNLLSPVSSMPSSMAGSVTSQHRAGPIRHKDGKRKSDAGKELANKPVRGGPMTEHQKSKADLVRDLGACWRCRRYKKSCDGPGECSNCMRGNFRVWPSSLGCKRGCLEELVAHLVPAHAADILVPAARMSLKSPNWRFGTVNQTQRQMIEEQLPSVNSWQRLSLKVQSTGMYGGEFASLLDIVTKYQATQSRPNALLEASISLLDATCDIYQGFVASAWPMPPADINTAIITAQRAYASVSKMFLTSALSGRRRDWLPSFLSMCMAFCAVMIMMDAAIAVPAQARTMLWGSVHEVSRDLRTRLYPVTTDLLRASSNGTKPFALGCWTVNEHVNPQDGSIELVRSPEGMRMLGSDKAAFDGMRSLQEWIRRNIRLMDLGTKVITSDPFTTPEVPSIAAVLKLFDL